MRKILVVVCIFALGIFPPAAHSSEQRPPAKSATPLNADEIAIYRAVLQHYVPQASASLNVSATTYPFDSASPMNPISHGECLKGIELENLDVVSRSFHDLTPDVLLGKNMRLVDPNKQRKIVRDNDPDKTMREGKSVNGAVADAFSTALFSMSEIAFDDGHHYAVVSYRFWCGSLCGNGSTLVFQKFGEEWRKTERRCGSWVS
jgi:hypothetical protein